MISPANLFKLSRHRHVEESVLDELFTQERSTLITTILLETILLYILTPLIGNIIIAWYGVIMVLSLWRFYNAYDYHKHPERNTPRIWHEKFVIQVWLTALLFSGLALVTIPELDAYYQLFTFIVLIGISSGAIKALSSDHRTAIGYLIIILFPLMVEMVLLMRQDTLILAFLVAIYFFVQISILLHSYELSVQARVAQQEIAKAQEALFEKQEIIQLFFAQTDEALFVYDQANKLIDCNEAFGKLFGVGANEIDRYKLETFPDIQWINTVRKALAHEAHSHLSQYRTSGGKTLWLETRCQAMYSQEGTPVGGVGVIKDKTAEHIRGQELAHLATHDAMTGLANRRGFQEYITRLVGEERHRSHVSLFFYLDVNKFKQINDRYGHETGDRVIIAVANRLQKLAPPEANVTRLGGDEFCLIIPYAAAAHPEAREQMERWMRQIEGMFDAPFLVGEHHFDLRCSIGAVYIEPGETDIDRIVAQADFSMLSAKRTHSDHAVLYRRELEDGTCQAYEVQHTLDHAIAEEQLVVLFQPVRCPEGDRIASAEALIRWQHPEKGLLPPREFLSVAIGSGQVVDMDRWILKRTCRQVGAWKQSGLFSLKYVSVNIDTQSLIAKTFVSDLVDLMEQNGLERSQIRLEISTGSLARQFEEAYGVIAQLHRLGIACILDDFGTGCLPPHSIARLPASTVKIDRTYAERMGGDDTDLFLLQTVIALASNLHDTVIFKGIETQTQHVLAAKLDAEACWQGSQISPPLFEEDFVHLLTKH